MLTVIREMAEAAESPEARELERLGAALAGTHGCATAFIKKSFHRSGSAGAT